jgi:integrase
VRERELQPRTRELYESLLRSHIRPYLGSRSLDKINSQAVRTWRKRLLDDGRTPIIAAKSHRLLRAVLNTAVNEDRLLRAVLNTAVNEDRLLTENPCRMRGYDKEETGERPVGPVSTVITLSEVIERRYRALVLFAAFTGLRWVGSWHCESLILILSSGLCGWPGSSLSCKMVAGWPGRRSHRPLCGRWRCLPSWSRWCAST